MRTANRTKQIASSKSSSLLTDMSPAERKYREQKDRIMSDLRKNMMSKYEV